MGSNLHKSCSIHLPKGLLEVSDGKEVWAGTKHRAVASLILADRCYSYCFLNGSIASCSAATVLPGIINGELHF